MSSSPDGDRDTYLVICDSISEVLDEAVQSVGVVDVLQELQKLMLFRKRSELCNDPNQLPGNS